MQILTNSNRGGRLSFISFIIDFSMFPIKKEYKKIIVDSKWNKIASIEYEQATMYERYKFVYSEKQWNEIIDFVLQNIVYEKNIYKLKENDIVSNLLQGWFVDELMDTRYKTYKSIYEGGAWWRKAIEQANIVFVCKELWISPHDLIHNYTMEEYQYYLDGVIYNANESYKEWQQINDMARMKADKWTKASQERLQEEADFLDSLDKKWPSKQSQ